MVAEAEAPSKKAAFSPNRRAALRIPLMTRIKARNLYVSQQLAASEVGKACGLTPKQVFNLAMREGWTKTRKELERKAELSADARTQRDIEELVEEVANDTAELSLGTLAKAKKTLERDDEFAAKDLQAYSVAAKNFVGMYREAKRLDADRKSEGNTTNLIFVGSIVRVQDEKRAESINVPTTQSESAAPPAAKTDASTNP